MEDKEKQSDKEFEQLFIKLYQKIQANNDKEFQRIYKYINSTQKTLYILAILGALLAFVILLLIFGISLNGN